MPFLYINFIVFKIIKSYNKKGDEMKNKYKWIIGITCLILFLALLEDVVNKDIMKGDILGYKIVSKYLINNSITPIVKFITNFGGGIFLIILTIILFITIKNKKIGFSVAINLVTITLINQLLKIILHRPRPIDNRIINEFGYSFPSGHSMISMAFYGYLIYLIYKYVKNKKIKYLLMVALILLILVIGISRIYLGVHYTSDVLAGFLFSIFYLIIYIRIQNKFIK